MPITKQEWLNLEKKAYELRNLCLDTTFWAGGGHIGGGMSVMDILTLMYHKYMKFDPKNPTDDDRDRMVVSKGHVGIAIAPVLADLGLIDIEKLKTFNLTNSSLGMHLDCNKVPGLDASTGSLGHGSSLALGMALAARVRGKDYKTYVILGDGECDEGAVWEAAMATNHFNATNLLTMVDRNKCMIDGNTEDIMKLEPFADKWIAFGFKTYVVNGHNMQKMVEVLDEALLNKTQPVCIILDTVKGEGIDFMEGNYVWHYGAINEENYVKAQASLEEHYKKRIERVNKEG